MPAINLFKHALAAKQPQIGIWSTLPYPYISELLAGAGFDWIMLDTEHAPSDPVLMLQQLQAVQAERDKPTSAVVRPPWNDSVLIKQYLDIGAQTLLLPFVQNRAEAEAAVAATRYPPGGIRGMGGTMRASRFGRDTGYVAQAERELCVLVQVETAEALEQLEDIANVDGVDGVFIGPGDLSASMGVAGQVNHPTVRAAIDAAIRRILACGKAPGILMLDEPRARECLNLGALFVAVATDQVLLRKAADDVAARFKSASVSGAPVNAAAKAPATY
ncbi:4-hydroxy-2-oxo-heptane-1,7-dioate aldolase [Variovorax sp. PAMC28562]|uniref:aldolase/citrate lyase family protein n=1 Tax=Variovorax sp. PAMC28562 TaxID=2762323 RepID=UPI00164E1AA5|nr:aldolase/citrate lyase family protein [Variovorax sp. PAMC28562]QNK73864.1 4-hydroxy-2-oxo-heptane-1,7-dioate aldolase [Variovorax sp. PAMC28562]